MKFLSILLFLVSGAVHAESPVIVEELNNDALVLESMHLKIADIVAQIQNKNGACGEIEAYTSDIVESLKKAKSYYDVNSYVSDRPFTPSPDVLNALGTTLVLKDIMGEIDYSNIESFQKALEGVVMHGPAPGVLGHMSFLTFGEGGTVIEKTANWGNGDNLIDAPIWEEHQGTFEVEDRNNFGVVIAITFSDGYEKRLVLNYGFEYNQWYLLPLKTIEFYNNPYMDGYVDLSDQCSA